MVRIKLVLGAPRFFQPLFLPPPLFLSAVPSNTKVVKRTEISPTGKFYKYFFLTKKNLNYLSNSKAEREKGILRLTNNFGQVVVPYQLAATEAKQKWNIELTIHSTKKVWFCASLNQLHFFRGAENQRFLKKVGKIASALPLTKLTKLLTYKWQNVFGAFRP